MLLLPVVGPFKRRIGLIFLLALIAAGLCKEMVIRQMRFQSELVDAATEGLDWS